jgi:hypothetical protein
MRFVGRHRALLAVALLLCLIKLIQALVDPQVVFFFDSKGFLVNAYHGAAIPYRSYTYGRILHFLLLPFHQLPVLVYLQAGFGALSSWLLYWVLRRYFHVSGGFALAAALLFAMDPSQVLYEHMMMAETATLLACVVYLACGLQYLRDRSLVWLPIIAVLGILVVSLRIVHLPVVLVMSGVLPIVDFLAKPFNPRRLAFALLLSCLSTLGLVAAYNAGLQYKSKPGASDTSYFLFAAVSPLVIPSDAKDPRVAELIRRQTSTHLPPDFEHREPNFWNPDGYALTIKAVYGDDEVRGNQQLSELARAAIRRDPLGFVWLAWQTWIRYFDPPLYSFRQMMLIESGVDPPDQMSEPFTGQIRRDLNADVSQQASWETPSRRYHMALRYWYFVLWFTPLVFCLLLAAGPINRSGVGLLAVWVLLLAVATSFGSCAVQYRYLHPYSWAMALALGVAGELCYCRVSQRSSAGKSPGSKSEHAPGEHPESQPV